MKTALLVIDMQKYFDQIVDKPMPEIRRLNDYFREKKDLIVFTQHGHAPEELIPPIKNQLVRKVGPENAIVVNTKEWELVPEIWKMARDAPVTGKNTYDAFMHTDLDTVLKDRCVERVLISGVMSDVCCDTTARSAFVRGYETWYISDACWTDTQEQHSRALANVEFLIGRVYKAADAIAMLEEEKAAASRTGP